MTEAIEIPGAADASSAVSASPAVARCVEAWTSVFQAEIARSNSRAIAAYKAGKAYRIAMPLLSGYENVRDFVACTAHGLLIGAIDGSQSSKLLYAAQVALTTVRSQPAPQKPVPA
jgi:hypothetical protein